MRSVVTISVTLIVLISASVALSQPRSLRGRVPPGREAPPPPAAQPPPPVRTDCPVRRSIMAQEEERLNAAKGELAGIDTEVSQLKQRIADLTRQRGDVIRVLAYQDQRYKSAAASYKSMCGGANESCDQYDSLADGLDRQGTAIETDLNNIRSEIENIQREIGMLRGRIEPLQREYADKRCSNLVPGETAQDTIDRCTAIFSDWNRLQSQLNTFNNRLPLMRGTYQQKYTELQNIETRAKQYDDYMGKNCSTSQRVVIVHNYGQGNVRRRADELGKQLDQLVNDVAQLRGIRITVEPKK